MTREFVKGETYAYREFKHVVTGGPDCPDDALHRYIGDGIFELVRPTFIPGQLYRHSEIEEHTWCPSGACNAEPDTMFLCARVEGSELLEFIEAVEPSPHSLVPATEAQGAVSELQLRGFSLRDVARAAGVSENTAARAAAGHGFVRRATVAALEAAASLNGQPS